MTLRQAKNDFRIIHHKWIEEHKSDKIMVNEAYAGFLDCLCKSGEITQRQWQNATNFYRR
jgi:hypothetical protein